MSQPAVHHYVYALVDEDERVFYVGISMCPWERFFQHIKDRASSAWAYASVFGARMVIVAKYRDRQAALDHEYKLLCGLPSLCNRAYYHQRVWRR